MPTYRVVYNKATKVARVQAQATAVPGGSVSIGTFDHPDEDILGAKDNHVVFHHVRDLLYQAGVQDLGYVSIVAADGVLPISVIAIHVSPASLSTTVNGTVQLTTEFVPTNASNKSLNYESQDPTVATVSGTGLVTGKKVGTTIVGVQSVDGEKMDTVSVTVTA